MQKPSEIQLEKVELPGGVELRDFRPVAYYDKQMDFIRVVTHDRSITEHRLNEFYTVHEINNRCEFDPKYAGFTIKGVHSLFSEIGLSLEGTYRLAELIDTVVKHRPGSVMSQSLSLIFENYKSNGDLKVDISKAA